MSAYCSSCGNALPLGARFCSSCGSVVFGAQAYTYQPFTPQPRLVRPIYGRQFAGVCAGVARTYGWDLGLIRVLTVVSGIFLFPFIEVVYIAGWIGIPEEQLVMPGAEAPPQPQV